MTDAGERERHVLLVEDNPLDARATIRGLTTGHRPYVIDHVTNSATALERLEDAHTKQDLPDLVLLDLNLDGIDGIDLLHLITSDDRFAGLPAVVLTTSDHRSDILRASEHGAAAFLTKPHTLDEWAALVREVDAVLGTT